MNTWIKICGLTRLEDVSACLELGVHALGFNFYSKSPRSITPARAKELVALLPPSVEAVGVFVNADHRQIASIANEVGLSSVQLHRDEQEVLSQVSQSLRVIQVLRPRTSDDIRIAFEQMNAERILLDAFSEHAYGGTGKVVDAKLLATAIETTPRPLIVSGGLKAENVGDVVAKFRPYGVDVASGVEQSPGIKDRSKLERFCAAVRAVD